MFGNYYLTIAFLLIFVLFSDIAKGLSVACSHNNFLSFLIYKCVVANLEISTRIKGGQ